MAVNIHPKFARILDMRSGHTADNYRGWAISYDPPPIPIRYFDWCAAHPDYDGDDEHLLVFGRDREQLIDEIDAWYLEQVA